MSDEGRIRSQIKDLEAIRKGHLSGAERHRAEARRYRSMRDNPPSASRAFEHQRSCDQKAAQAERDADSDTRSAESVLNRIRGLQAYLR